MNYAKRNGHVSSPDNSYDASDEGSHDSSAGEEESPCGSRQKTYTRDIDSLSADPDLEPQAHKRRKVNHIPSETPLDPTAIPSYMHEESHAAPRRGSNAVLNRRKREWLSKQLELKRLELEDLQSQYNELAPPERNGMNCTKAEDLD
ncbi:hypothetical protein JB92DRAFT_3129158 [Gautieria morchelliformis]|nr:hypothetical protein JB92DRAFT_3129158 [Gautieria morchelliformis]